tara:strand:+ start:561 stop:1466 length:906 start_codon:yes stop_codon:yes gene_type:complete
MKIEALRESVTARIVKALETGVKPWSAGWDGQGYVGRPLRYNGGAYRGINVLMLWMAATQFEFQSPYWMTFRQAGALEARICKGAKGTPVIVYKPLGPSDDEHEVESSPARRGFSRTYHVFNAEQIEGLPDHFYPARAADGAPRQHDALSAYDALMSFHQPHYEEGPQPCYIPARDVVRWPAIGAFHSPQDHLATACHELAHWSGAGQRLARDGIIHAIDKQRYAYEELVAELAAAFMGASFGILGKQIDDHASYIAAWIRLLKDPGIIFRAAADAERACDFLITPTVCDALAPNLSEVAT